MTTLASRICRWRGRCGTRRHLPDCGKLCIEDLLLLLMHASLEALQAEVLRLSPSDRARLRERLILSLDADAEAEAAWDAAATAREAEITSGAVAGVSLDDAITRLEARFRV